MLLQAVRAFAICFVQNKNVANLHEPSLHVLDVVAEPWHQHHQHTIRQPHDVNFILANANRLDQYVLFPSGIQ